MNIKTLVKGMIVEENFAVISTTRKKTNNAKTYLIAELAHPTGTIQAKVWEDSLASAPLIPNKVFRISAVADSFREIISLTISQAFLVEDKEIEDYINHKPTLVFDIETSGRRFEELEKWDQDYLLNTLQKQEDDKEKAKESTALYPLYGKIVSIGMFCPEKEKGSVLILSPKKIELENKKFKCQNFKTEKELLEAFWNIYIKFEKYVTFNGKGFDLPFLLFRSAFNKVKVPVEIKSYGDEHTDLMQKFKMGFSNAFKLEALCRAFDITNPKDKGVSGKHVSNLYDKKKFKEIADYVSRDAISTSELYLIWKNFMAGKIIV